MLGWRKPAEARQRCCFGESTILPFVALPHLRGLPLCLESIPSGGEGPHVAAPLLDLVRRDPPLPYRDRHGQEGPRARRLRPRPPQPLQGERRDSNAQRLHSSLCSVFSRFSGSPRGVLRHAARVLRCRVHGFDINDVWSCCCLLIVRIYLLDTASRVFAFGTGQGGDV